MSNARSIPDLILINANIITLDPAMPKAGWVALKEGKIQEIGKSDTITKYNNSNTQVIDCNGKTVLPGFIDSHLHLSSFVESLITLNLKPETEIRSISDIQSRIHEVVQNTPPGEWIKGKGYNEFYLREKRHPNRHDLDKVSPDHPVKLTHRSGHAHVLNSLAMKLTGITIETPEPPEGIIERDLETGEPTGLLYEMGDFLSKRIPPLDDVEIEKGIRIANQELVSVGITTIHDASINNDLSTWDLFRSWKEDAKLQSRLKMMLGCRAFKENNLDDTNSFLGPEKIKIDGVKIILDETTGRLNPSQDELDTLVHEIHRSKMQAAIHAITENAIESAHIAIKRAIHETPGTDHRHRIEHCSVCPPALAVRLAELGVMVVSQPNFIYYNGDRYIETVKDGQLDHLYSFNIISKAGVTVAGSSDCPYAPVNPLIAISAAISRKTREGRILNQNQAVKPLEALKMYTTHGAYSSFDESIKGTVSPGKVADLVILDGNPLEMAADDIRDIKVEMTIIDGRVVWDTM